ncbi:hypothetical protein EMCRGX_G017654 [Ephydatia muelleri]
MSEEDERLSADPAAKLSLSQPQSTKSSPSASPQLGRKTTEASPNYVVKKRDSEDTIAPLATSSSSSDPPLLEGELLNYTAPDITYLDHFEGAQIGTLYITDYKLYFKSSKSQDNPLILDVPLGAISHVEKMGRSRAKGENAYGLQVFCKDLRVLTFASKQESHARRGVYDRLQIVAFPVNYGKNVFAFNYKAAFKEDGWKVFNIEDELKRLGVGSDNVPWRLCYVNKNYSICETYPPIFSVPSNCDDHMIEVVSQFRSKGRLPVLSWLHPVTHASITRSSQPLMGAKFRRCTEDEGYIQNIQKANKSCSKLYILDARPKINAMANVPMGGGYESEEVYTNMDFSFLNIENIHVMRESLAKLQDVCFPDVDDQKWFTNLESTHWLDNIKAVMTGAVKVVELVEKQKASVFVHCTDGWDRTAQLSSLAMLMLDSYYRTIRGFEVLIEKEWVSFGHKFNQRIGHGDRNHGDDQRAPIFLQFIDCVWQISNQYPYAFEFNELFLVMILDHLYSCLFGTFLSNCEKSRSETNLREKTVSLWSFMNSQIDVYKNPLYSAENPSIVLTPSASIRRLQLWHGYYLRWNPRMKPQESEQERCKQLKKMISLIKERCNHLEQQQNGQPETVAAVV